MYEQVLLTHPLISSHLSYPLHEHALSTHTLSPPIPFVRTRPIISHTIISTHPSISSPSLYEQVLLENMVGVGEVDDLLADETKQVRHRTCSYTCSYTCSCTCSSCCSCCFTSLSYIPSYLTLRPPFSHHTPFLSHTLSHRTLLLLHSLSSHTVNCPRNYTFVHDIYQFIISYLLSSPPPPPLSHTHTHTLTYIQECSKYGPVQSCVIHEEPDSVRIFIRFETQESAVRAFRDMNGRSVLTHPIDLFLFAYLHPL